MPITYPTLPWEQVAFLGLVAFGFIAFWVSLFSVWVFVNLERKALAAAPEVQPAVSPTAREPREFAEAA